MPRRRRARGRTEVRPEAARTELRTDGDSGGAVGIDPEDDAWSAEIADFDPAEFAEFLEADETPLPVDPGFRERLRNQLWGMVRERADAARPRGLGPDGRTRTPPQPDPKPRR